ncbi:hypothetical protein LP417_35380 (plasmid) [Polaromonas sp. P1-6]|nr:hypothetical protein LP417_35380 [Polaromonas sp. P1-6]
MGLAEAVGFCLLNDLTGMFFSPLSVHVSANRFKRSADHNAAKVIAARGVKQLLAGKVVRKEKRRCGILRNKVEAEGLKPAAAMPPTLGETEGKSFGWQHPGALVVDPRNPRYSSGLAVGDFIEKIVIGFFKRQA